MKPIFPLIACLLILASCVGTIEDTSIKSAANADEHQGEPRNGGGENPDAKTGGRGARE